MRALLIVFCLCSQTLFAQIGEPEQRQVLDLKDGIYLRFEQFRANAPIPADAIVSHDDPAELDFLEKQIMRKTISIRVTPDSVQEFSTRSIWGYCNNGKVYIHFEGEFNRIPIVGSICHFTAVVVTEQGVYDPYRYDQGRFVTREMRQYILDLQTGRILLYDLNNLTFILQRDPALLQEFNAVPKRKRKKMMFIYLRRYNELHPASFVR